MAILFVKNSQQLVDLLLCSRHCLSQEGNDAFNMGTMMRKEQEGDWVVRFYVDEIKLAKRISQGRVDSAVAHLGKDRKVSENYKGLHVWKVDLSLVDQHKTK